MPRHDGPNSSISPTAPIGFGSAAPIPALGAADGP